MFQYFVSLPPDIQMLITIGVTFLVSFLLLQLANVPALKWLAEYLGQNKVQIVTWAVGLIVAALDGLLVKVPLAWEPVVIIAFQLVAAVFAALGVFAVLAKRGYKAFI